MKIGIIYHPDFKKYDFGSGNPMRGEYYLDGNVAFSLINKNRELMEKAEISFVEPAPATEEDVLTVHTEEYVGLLREYNEKGGLLTPDTPVKKGLYETAKLTAGADILAGKLVVEKKINKGFVFGMIGHHAGADFGGGFCLINDVAIMIEHLRRNYGLKRILVIDYAANNGHGTQSIYYDTPEVLCIDIHQDPLTLYPGTGFPVQVGINEGEGYTVNICLPPYSTDKHCLSALNEIVVPIVLEYKPELIVALGLNGCHFTLKINQLMFTLNGLQESVRIFSRLSDQVCEGRIINIGGFSLDKKLLPLGFMATVAGALDMGGEITEPYSMTEEIPDVTEDVEEFLSYTKKIQQKYWKYL